MATHLDRVERTTSALRMELDTPDLLARLSRRLDAFNRRVVAVDEEGLPAAGERILEFERVLVVLTIKYEEHATTREPPQTPVGIETEERRRTL